MSKFHAEVTKLSNLEKLHIKLYHPTDLTQALKNAVRCNTVKALKLSFDQQQCLDQSCSKEADQMEEMKALLAKNTALQSAIIDVQLINFPEKRGRIFNVPLMLVLLRRRAVLNEYGFWTAASTNACALSKLIELLAEANNYQEDNVEVNLMCRALASSSIDAVKGSAVVTPEENDESEEPQSHGLSTSIHDIQFELLLRNPSTWCGV
jgi:hypothetical protein